jgi:uncharacterized protein (DUF3820 family)
MPQCPECGKDASVYHSAFSCENGHTWGDAVALQSRPQEEPKPKGLRMPFGKHRGELLEDLPLTYINWCLENIDNLGEIIRIEMENQQKLKSGEGVLRQETRMEGTKFIYGKGIKKP